MQFIHQEEYKDLPVINNHTLTQDEKEFADFYMPDVGETRISDSKNSPTINEMEFADYALQQPTEEESPWYKSYPAALGKGIVKGVVQLGESFGGLRAPPQQKAEEEEKRSEVLKEYLPSEEGFVEGALERGGKLLPGVLAGPGGVGQAVARSGAAAISGETAKKYGFGEMGQAIAELPALLSPGLAKTILPTKGQKEIVTEARRLGLSEKEIAPLIQAEKKLTIGKKFSYRGDNVQKVLKGSKEAVGNLYTTLEESAAGKNIIPKEVANTFFKDLEKPFAKITDAAYKKIQPDYQKLIDGDITGEKLVNFWQKLNKYISKGDPELGLIKGPLKNAMKGVSPEFSKDFEIINDLYARSAKIRKALSPKDENIVMKFMEATAPYQVVGSLLSGYYPAMATVLGEVGARKLATYSLTNPRFQNLGKQIVKAAADNKVQLADNLMKVFKKELEEEIPDYEKLFQESNQRLQRQSGNSSGQTR